MTTEERNSMLGTKFPQYSFTVERGKIREFAAAIGDMKDIYLDREMAAREGYSDVAAPPTFGTVMDHWAKSGSDIYLKLQINPVKVLHGEQEYEYLGDIVAGDELKATMTLTGYSEKKNMYIFTFQTVYVNQRNDEVLKCRQVVLERK